MLCTWVFSVAEDKEGVDICWHGEVITAVLNEGFVLPFATFLFFCPAFFFPFFVVAICVWTIVGPLFLLLTFLTRLTTATHSPPSPFVVLPS